MFNVWFGEAQLYLFGCVWVCFFSFLFLGGGASCEASTGGSCCTGVWGGRGGFAGVHPFPALSPMLHHHPERICRLCVFAFFISFFVWRLAV